MKHVCLVCLSLILLTGIAWAEEPVVATPQENAVEAPTPAVQQDDAVGSELFPAEGCQQQDPTGEQIFASIPDPGCQLNPGVNCNLTYKGYCDTFCGLNCSICQANGCCICTVCQWP